MASTWHQKKAKQADLDFERALQTSEDTAMDTSKLVRDSAMGGGDAELFEKKLSKDEKKAVAKAKRDAKKKARKGGEDDDEPEEVAKTAAEVLQETKDLNIGGDNVGANAVKDGIDHEAADALAAAGTICTFSASRKGVDARARDVNVTNFTLQHMGAILLDETEVVLNHGNRYGLIGRNGCGKSSLLKALGARAIPVPTSIDLFFLKEEIEPSDTMTALEAVMSVDEERLKLEQQAEELNRLLAEYVENPPDAAEGQEEKTPEEVQEEVMEALNSVYERLDALDASTAEVRARSILSGLGFTHAMQSKLTKDFSGGWRMRVSLARALFIRPVW
jgi:ATP-binding cassette subfamily F protein 2